jgi:hypothetical protein
MFLLAKMIDRWRALGRVLLIVALLLAAITVRTPASGGGTAVGGINPHLGQRPAPDALPPPPVVPPLTPGP